MTLPQSKSRQYADVVIDITTTEFRLRQIIKNLEASLKSHPYDADVLMVLGMALFRVGRHEDGIHKMYHSVNLSPDKTSVNNLVISLTEKCKYEEAWNLILKYNMEKSLFDIALCGHCELLKDDLDQSLKDSLTEISRLLLGITPYGSTYTVEVDEEDGQKIVDIKVMVPASVGVIFSMYNEFTKDMSKKFNSDILMRVIPRFMSSL